MSVQPKKQKRFSVKTVQGNVLLVFTERWPGTMAVEDDGNGPDAQRPRLYIFVRRCENGPYQFTRAFVWRDDAAANGELLWTAALDGWDVLRNPADKRPKEFSPGLTADEMRHEVIRSSCDLYTRDQLEKIQEKLRHADFVEHRFRV